MVQHGIFLCVCVSCQDKKEKKGKKTAEQETSLKKKKKQREMSPESEEPGTTERKKKRKKKPKNEAAGEILENATVRSRAAVSGFPNAYYCQAAALVISCAWKKT